MVKKSPFRRASGPPQSDGGRFAADPRAPRAAQAPGLRRAAFTQCKMLQALPTPAQYKSDAHLSPPRAHDPRPLATRAGAERGLPGAGGAVLLRVTGAPQPRPVRIGRISLPRPVQMRAQHRPSRVRAEGAAAAPCGAP
jgi:hypothetical protein